MTTRIEEEFTIMKKIGEGTFGQVYLVKSHQSGLLYAMKKVRIGNYENGIPQNPFREMQAMKHLCHSNIVKLYDIRPAGPNIGIIMEFMPCDLAKILSNSTHRLPQDDVRNCMRMILKGLAYCHRKSIMHRDIKPGNLLVSRSGVVKLADFGLSRVYAQNSQEKGKRTYSHQVATRWYRAPELLFGSRTYTKSVDVWSVGAIFAELLMHTPVFAAATDIGQIVKVIEVLGNPENFWPEVRRLPDYGKITFPDTKPRDLKEVIPNASSSAIKLLQKMLQYHPEKRITAEEALMDDYFFDSRPTVRPATLSSALVRVGSRDNNVKIPPLYERNREQYLNQPLDFIYF